MRLRGGKRHHLEWQYRGRVLPQIVLARRGGVPPARRDLFLIVLILIAVDAAAAALLVRVYYPPRRAEALTRERAQLSLLARDRQNALAGWVAERLSDAEVAAALIAPDPTGPRAAGLLDGFLRAYRYESCVVIDDAGAVLLRRGRDRTDLATIAAFVREQPQAPVPWIDFRRNALREPRVLSACRIAGESRATVVFVSDPYDFVYPLFSTVTVASQTGETNLIGLQGEWAVGLSPYRFGAPPPMTARAPMPHEHAAKLLAEGERTIRLIDRRGQQVIGVAKAIPRTRWVVFAKIDEDEAIEGAVRETERLGELFGLTSLLVAMASFVLLRSRRVSKMRAAQEQLGRLYEHTTTGVLVMRVVQDEEGRAVDHELIDMNPAAEQFFGVAAASAIGKRSSEAPFLDWPDDIRARNYDVALTGRSTHYERYDAASGRWYDTRCFSPGAGQFAQLLTDVTERRKSEEAVRHLTARALRVQDETQRRIARELHETVAQSLAGLRMNLATMGPLVGADDRRAELVADSIRVADDAIAEVRTVSYLLHPPMIDQAGLLTALRWYTEGFQQRSGIVTTLDAPADPGPLPKDLETTVFRIVQESLTNVQRHSGSATARVSIVRTGDVLSVAISDEGHGLPPRLRQDHSALLAAGVGVAGIRERVDELGGSMRVESSDAGTTLTVTLPIRRAERDSQPR